MLQLNLPSYHFKIKKENEKFFILDTQRKKWVTLTPEEWVRQHFIRYLIEEKKFPAALLAVEKQVNINGLKKRCDAILYNLFADPLVLIEFKAPHVPITQEVFDQMAVYNAKLNVDFFMVSNGLEHYFCRVDTIKMKYEFMDEIPNHDFFIN